MAELPEIPDYLKDEFLKAVRNFIYDWSLEQSNITLDDYMIKQTFERLTNVGGSLKNDPVASPILSYFRSRCPDLYLELVKDETYPTAARCMLTALDRRSVPPKP
jgi:hypothetical protein